MAFAGLSMIALVFVAALVAYMYYFASAKGKVVVAGSGTQASEEDVFEDDDLF